MRTQDFIAEMLRAEARRLHELNGDIHTKVADAMTTGWVEAAQFVEELDLSNFRPTED